jgi:hypothetical protein
MTTPYHSYTCNEGKVKKVGVFQECEHLFKPSSIKPLAWLNLWAQGAYEQPAGSTSYAPSNKQHFQLCRTSIPQQLARYTTQLQVRQWITRSLWLKFTLINVCTVLVTHTHASRHTLKKNINTIYSARLVKRCASTCRAEHHGLGRCGVVFLLHTRTKHAQLTMPSSKRR